MEKTVASFLGFIIYVVIVNIMSWFVIPDIEDRILRFLLVHGSSILIQIGLSIGLMWIMQTIIVEEYDKGKYTLAIRYLRFFKPLMSLLSEPEILESVMLFDAREYAQAEQLALQGLEKTETDKAIGVYASVLALVEYQRGNIFQAIHYLEKVCNRQGDFGAAHMYLAQFYLEQGQLQKANAILKKVLMKKSRLKDKTSLGHLEIAFARALVKSGKPQESLDMLKQGMTKINENRVSAVSEAHFWAGRMFHENNRPDYAIKHYQKAVSADPNGHWGYIAKLLIHNVKSEQNNAKQGTKKTTDSLLRTLEGQKN